MPAAAGRSQGYKSSAPPLGGECGCGDRTVQAVRQVTTGKGKSIRAPPKIHPPPRMPTQVIVPLIVACALFMENLDSTVISTALPAISVDLHEDPIAL